MRKLVSRYGKQVMVFICTLVIMAGSICSFSFVSRAAGDVYYLEYAEPATSEGQGYLVILMQDNVTSQLYVMTLFWSTYAVKSGYLAPSEMIITLTDNTVNFNIQQYDASGVWYTVSAVTEYDNYRTYAHSNSGAYTFDLSTWNYSIRGWKVKGNGYVQGLYNSVDFAVFFSEDGEAILLQEIIELLSRNNSTNSSILTAVQSILNSVDGVEGQLSSVVSYLKSIDDDLSDIETELKNIYDKADALLKEQEETNSWLEKIYNKIVEALGLEGEESTEPLPDEEIGSVIESEDALIQDTTDAEASMDFSVDSNSNNVVWNIIERVLNSHSAVFGSFIGIMTLGIVTLLLNR